MAMSPEEEERHWEEEAGMRFGSPFDPGYEPAPDECNWSVAAQLSGFSGFLIPFGNIALPLIIWLIKREESPFIEYHAREALNFQISMTLYVTIASLLIFVLIGFVLLPALIVFETVVMIRAALWASRGELYEYPLSIRLVS